MRAFLLFEGCPSADPTRFSSFYSAVEIEILELGLVIIEEMKL